MVGRTLVAGAAGRTLVAGVVGRILAAGTVSFDAGAVGLLFKGCPTGISQRCPGSPWRGLRPVLFNVGMDVPGLAVEVGATVFETEDPWVGTPGPEANIAAMPKIIATKPITFILLVLGEGQSHYPLVLI